MPSEPESPSPTPKARGPGAEAVVAALLGLALVAGLVWWSRSAPGYGPGTRPLTVAGSTLADPRFVGSSACRECHPGEHALHNGSGHARTLRRAATPEVADRLVGREAPDPDQTGVTWRYRLEGDRLVAERLEAGKVERFPLELALGSGQHAVTFVTRLERPSTSPEGLEHRLTYFASDGRLGLTPGQETGGKSTDKSPGGARLTPAVLRDCLECHGTPTTNARGGLDPTTLVPNVTCERCHGPGLDHIAAARAGPADTNTLVMPFGPGRNTGPEQVMLCGRCHRIPEMVPPETIRAKDPVLARFPPVGLVQSACFQGSRGVLTCTTCHDAHGRAAAEPARYEAACLSCHQPDRGRACPIDPRSGCVSCHMPRRDVGHGLMFSDHWIRADRSRAGSADAPAP
jgi:hypothetical protein